MWFLQDMENTNLIHIYNDPFAYSFPVYKSGGASRWSKIFSRSAKYLVIAGLLVLIISYAPAVWYALKTGNGATISQILKRPGDNFGELMVASGDIQKPLYQPAFNSQLPTEPRITIPSIGLDTTLQEASLENYEEALKKGVWRVPDFGTPYDRERPTILSAHRFGYLAWSNLYRRRNSFFNLPKAKVGDIVEIAWRQRKYVYEIYGESEGADINDYTADLILYTCRQLDSDVRIFKYARLLEI